MALQKVLNEGAKGISMRMQKIYQRGCERTSMIMRLSVNRNAVYRKTMAVKMRPDATPSFLAEKKCAESVYVQMPESWIFAAGMPHESSCKRLHSGRSICHFSC